MRILIPSVQVPFINGGATIMTQGLQNALKRYGHEVEIVTIPFKFSPESYVNDLIDIWSKQDFNEFNGYYIDKVIALQFPAFYVNHSNKILWLMHQHRTVYELYDKQNISDDLRQKIINQDTTSLSKIEGRFSMCQNVSNRLFKYNGLSSTPVYHPPLYENNFYCEDSYDYIFYPSRLENLKRQDLLIKAMQYTKSPTVSIIAGIGGQEEYYQKLISSLNLSHKVKLIGYISQKEKESYYARCLGVFFAPYDEDYGYITLETMLSSKPLITAKDSGGPLEFIKDGETGFIIEPTPQEIAQKIDWLYYNKQKAKIMGENAYQSYKDKNITWNNVVSTLMDN